jgi:SpoVK/Ycf46/Vps4 family AAA+-type ATPase
LSELLLLLNVIADNRNCTIENFKSTLDHTRSNTDNTDNPNSHHSDILEGQCAHIIVVAATNRIEDCDSALLRRFGIQLEVSLPSRKDREKMLHRHLKGIDHIVGKNEMKSLAMMTEQWSGSALENLAREACMRPIRECLHRAAVIRRRTEIREQQGGDASGQWDDPESPDVVANKCLLEDFQRLRQVTIGDFRSAISTLTGVAVSVIVQAPFVTVEKPKKVEEHYDSSSDEENI